MKISIAMAAYNGAEHIAQQLESFSRQTRLPDELVVCDDGSRDGTLDILASFRDEAPFEVAIHRNEKNLGFGPNFGKALGLCTGDLVFLSDQDDVWLPEKVDHMLGLAGRMPGKCLWLHDAEITGGGLERSGNTKLGQLRRVGLDPDRSFVQGGCIAMRREFLDFALPIPAAYKAHDSWLVELAGLLGAKHIDPRALIYYRIHGKNTSANLLNRSGKVTYLQKVRHRLAEADSAGTRHDLAVEGAKLAAQEKRIAGGVRSALGRLLAPDAVPKALRALAGRKAALERRMGLMERPRMLRAVPALSLLLRGDYARHFNGYDSFLKDVIA